ncbi:hypothetical protein BGZ80_006678 [Entomortierella chlamydospora]|uniref:FAD-binding domain-containing protein n=1 Tax=Entomortierella chlamydospora TaxID=101097 RepID=A0A9P6MGE0_9FUNG|nr:hypothetical protein BGZ80_006678 [Entomortierella chlamydospora]
MSILTISHKQDVNSIKALIVGGGITGLSMAIMMHLAGMEFDILERSTGNEPAMGSAIALGPPVLRLFEQMDLLPQIERSSKAVTGITIMDGESRRLGRVEGVKEDRYGYPMRVMTREALHSILMEKIPPANLHRGKLVVKTLQNANGASCKCSDGSTYYGDIIIGADGAQSLTREKMFLPLIEKCEMFLEDLEPSQYQHVICAGITDPLDQNSYPAAHDSTTEIRVISNKENQAGNPTPRFYDDWLVQTDIDLEEKFKDLLDKRCAMGPGTIRDFIAHTPKKAISTIDMEERIYRTWHSERIVLIGDACHHQLSVGGQNPAQGILDAVCLVNLLRKMESRSSAEYTQVFKKYQQKRTGDVKTSFQESRQIDKIIQKQGLVTNIMRKLMPNSFVFNMKNDKINSNQPQLSFLPFVPDRRSSTANPQERSKKLTGERTLSI